MRRRIVVLFTALALVCACVPGCAAAIPIIHTIATAVATITGALDQAQAAVDAAPQADSALIARARDAIAKARKLLEVVRAADKVAEGAATQDYQAAVVALLQAYQAVLDAGRAFGVLAAPAPQRARLGAPPGVYLVATVDEVRAELARDGAR